EVYGLEAKDVFSDEDLALSTYRFSVSQLIPSITKQAWKSREKDIERLTPGIQQAGFVFTYSRAQFEAAYGRHYQRPSLFARILAFLYRLIPKIGPLKPLSFEEPTPVAEKLFVESFKDAQGRFVRALASIHDNKITLRNTDFDTGKPA